MATRSFVPLRGSIPSDADKVTVRTSIITGNGPTSPITCYRHFIVNEDPTIVEKSASGLIPILPRPEGVPVNTPFFASDRHGVCSPNFKPSRSKYNKEYASRPGVRERRNRQQRLRRLKKKNLEKGIFTAVDDANPNAGVLHQTFHETYVKYVDVYHRFGAGKHLRQAGDTLFYLDHSNGGGESSSSSVANDDDPDYVPCEEPGQ